MQIFVIGSISSLLRLENSEPYVKAFLFTKAPGFILFSLPSFSSPPRSFLQMHEMRDLFIMGSGEAMLQLIPPFQCRKHCQSVAMPIEPGDIGMEGPRRAGSAMNLFSF